MSESVPTKSHPIATDRLSIPLSNLSLNPTEKEMIEIKANVKIKSILRLLYLRAT